MPGLDKQAILRHLQAEALRLAETERQCGVPHDADAVYRHLAGASHAVARLHTWRDDDAAATLDALVRDADAPPRAAVLAHLAGLGVGPGEVLVERARFVVEETGCTVARRLALRRAH